jgi:agmatinase
MLVQTSTAVQPFLGSEIESTYEASRVVILPIPYEATTSYRKGCENGPDALLEASQQLENYDEELDRETASDVGIYTYSSIADTRNAQVVTSEQMLEVTRQTVAQLIQDDKFVIALGGEHSITTGIVQAYHEASTEPFTVIQMTLMVICAMNMKVQFIAMLVSCVGYWIWDYPHFRSQFVPFVKKKRI